MEIAREASRSNSIFSPNQAARLEQAKAILGAQLDFTGKYLCCFRDTSSLACLKAFQKALATGSDKEAQIQVGKAHAFFTKSHGADAGQVFSAAINLAAGSRS